MEHVKPRGQSCPCPQVRPQYPLPSDSWTQLPPGQSVATEQGAMFIVLRDGGEKALVPYREILDQLRAHKLPTLPWSASSPLFNPQRPRVVPPAK